MSKARHKNDIISALVERDLRCVLEKIFLHLDCQDLRTCKAVCKSWNDFLRNIFWQSQSTLNILKQRLRENWEQEKCKRVEVTLEGFACRENCSLNSRECDCALVCQEVSGACLLILLNSNRVDIKYSVNNEVPFKTTKLFDRPQYQIQLVMNNNLKLDEKVFLARPIYFKNKQPPKKKVKVRRNILLEIDEEDKSFLKVSCLQSDQVISRFQPYTGQPIQ